MWNRLEGLFTRYGERGQQPGESPGFMSVGSLRARGSIPVGGQGRLIVRKRAWLVLVLAVVVALAAVAGAALLFWPQVHLGQSDAALARLSLPGFAGRVTAVEVSSASEGTVPVALRQGELWPLRQVGAGERLTVVVTVRRPGWAGWLVGHDQRRSFSVLTPSAHLLGRWLQVQPRVRRSPWPSTRRSHSCRSRDPRPASRRRAPSCRWAWRRADAHSAGTVEVAAAARAWERLSTPVRVSWFPARPYPQLLVEPEPEAKLTPGGPLTLTFSEPVADVLGSARPRVSPCRAGPLA